MKRKSLLLFLLTAMFLPLIANAQNKDVPTKEACATPTNLTETDITVNSATLSWQGTSDSYVLQYRPWHQTGDKETASATMTTYEFSLSDFSGTGSIAIRHFDVSDQFHLNVDDIVVTNATGTTVFEENFEDCEGTMPTVFSNMDIDGDGYVWEIASGQGASGQGVSYSYVNGSYGIYSASYAVGVGALTPDNWLIISGIELGGSISFMARGQDPSVPYERFAVYVSQDAEYTTVSVNGTSYQVNDLEEATPYTWQVKGVCGEFESQWASSLFKTKDNVIVFATDGNWNDAANWKTTEGEDAQVPTIENKVRIDANAFIPAGVVAQAMTTTLNGGSITIKDGGQLKQGSDVKVTMEKEITGYGESDGNYYFIATPFTGRTLFEQDNIWGYVLNLTNGTYDFYAFDPTMEREWQNYKAGAFEYMNAFEGYLYANATDKTLKFTGTVVGSIDNSQTKNFNYDETSTNEWEGWTLVGNRFSCNGYLNYLDANDNPLEADFYVLNNDNTYTLMESNNALAPLTGAFMNYSATGKIQITSEAPTMVNRNGMLSMNLIHANKTVDQARVRFGQGYNLGKKSFRNSSKIYMPVENDDYAVVYTEEQGEMPVSFEAEENGTYTLSFNTENVEFGYLHLIDNMTGNDVDLLSTPSYSFEARTTDYTSRFKLVFATGNNSNSDDFAFFSNDSFVINNEGNATLQVVDMMGRIIKSETINDCANVNVNAAPGVYMLRLVNGNDVKVQKVVVK